MKEFKDRMLVIQDSQNKLMKEYQTLINEYESHDLVQENQTLLKQYEEYKLRLSELQEKYKQMEEENTKLRTSLMEQILDEKLNIIKISRVKLETYFTGKMHGHSNRLEAFEDDAKNNMNRLLEKVTRQLKGEKEEIIAKIEQVSAELNQKVILHRERLAEEERRLLHEVADRMDHLASEDVNEETIQRRINQNQIEMKIGLNWINKLGMLLIIFGVGAAFKYSYSTWFSGHMKGSVFFLLGALMLVGGEWFFRKQKRTFALGLLGGGISVLYGSIFYSYFLLHIINIYIGLSLSVLVSITAVLLSLRYHSRTICSLGLVGGYLPLFSYMGAFGLDGNAVYAAMGYLFLLNLFILIVSFRKRWVVVKYISFLFNTPSMIALVLLASSDAISMLYAIVTFVMYLGITLWYPIKYESKLSKWDVTLLALNTLTSCGTLYALFSKAGLMDFKGLLALIFCLVYIGLGRFIEKVMKEEKRTMLLFYATSLTFAVLMIPFQFGIQWFSMGWLVEGILLIVYGYLNKLKQLERAGWGIFLLCLGAFFAVDLGVYVLFLYKQNNFVIKYSSVIVGMLLITLFYAVQQRKSGAFLSGRLVGVRAIAWFKYFTVVNVWFYLLYETERLYNHLVPHRFSHFGFYEGLLIACMTIALAYTLTKITVLYDRLIKYYCVFLYAIGYLICLYVTMFIPALAPQYSQNSVEEYIALGVLIGFNVFIFFSSRDFLIAFIRRQYKNVELYPIILGVYLLGILTAFLYVQFRLGDVGLVFSLLYLLMAIAYIIYGFRARYVYIRRLGLGLSLFSTGKLFMFDLTFLSTGSKIIAYFCFGLVLLVISFIYQKVSVRVGEPHVQDQTNSKN
ncbi:MAG: rane protein [Paenibacillus sp.]|nr:rane protein [Paenibacillus sp.]